MRLIGLIIFFITFSLKLNASENVKFSIGIFYQAKDVYRGALIWREPFTMAGPTVRLYQKFVLRGPSLTYEVFGRKDQHMLNISVAFSDDNDPWIKLKDSEISFRNKRDGALESRVAYRYKFGYRNKFYLGGLVARDYIAYKNMYYELQAGTPLIPFFSTNLALSRAPIKTNEYIYGDGARDGWGHYRIEISNVIPFVPWPGIIINRFTHSKIISSENRTASYIGEGEAENNVFSTIWIYRFD